MIAIKKIMIPTDFSEYSNHALKIAGIFIGRREVENLMGHSYGSFSSYFSWVELRLQNINHPAWPEAFWLQ